MKDNTNLRIRRKRYEEPTSYYYDSLQKKKINGINFGKK